MVMSKQSQLFLAKVSPKTTFFKINSYFQVISTPI